MLHFKLVEQSPSISQIWLDLYCPQEPLSGFGDFALTPEQPKRLHLKLMGVGKNISSSMHCNVFFPNSISIHKILWIDSGKRPPAVPRRTSRSPPQAAGSVSPATSLKGRRVTCRGNTVGAAEMGSRDLTHRSFGDCKLPVQPVSVWPLHRVPASSTLLEGERGGVSVNVCPLVSSRWAEGRWSCLCLCQTKMYHAVPETIALSQLNYGCTIL